RPSIHAIHLCHGTLAFIFFYMAGPPPTATLFPYTTLFRSIEPPGNSLAAAQGERVADPGEDLPAGLRALLARITEEIEFNDAKRSEEHTSELQSLAYLVCRLLLEKKKRTRSRNV